MGGAWFVLMGLALIGLFKDIIRVFLSGRRTMDSSKNSRLEQELRAVKAKDIMSKSILSMGEATSLSAAADSMLKNRVSGMPVIAKNGRVKGIITITDLFVNMGAMKYGINVFSTAGIKKLKQKTPIRNLTVKSVMSQDVTVISENETLSRIIDIMVNQGMHTLPVLKDRKLIGVIGRRDAIKRFYNIIKGLSG